MLYLVGFDCNIIASRAAIMREPKQNTLYLAGVPARRSLEILVDQADRQVIYY